MIVITNYSIPNKDLAESELRSLQRINDIPTSAELKHFQIVKDKILCFDNYNMELVFEIYQNNIEVLMKDKLDEKEIWMIIGDLLSYLTDLKNLGLNNGDL